MEMDTESRMDWLLRKQLLIFDFKRTFDGLVGDDQRVLAEFVDWESSGPTSTFNELRDHLCGDAKFGFDVNHVYLFGLVFSCKESKKEWIIRTADLEQIDYLRHPKNDGGIVVCQCSHSCV